VDPNETLKQIRELTSEDPVDGEMLATMVKVLDEWLSNGGFPPGDWSHNVRGVTRRTVE
jgi:hypothetical protein